MIKLHTISHRNCQQCSFQALCLPAELEPEEVAKINGLISKVATLEKNEHVFHIQDEMKYLYAVYQGSCKEYWIDENGNECVTNFYFPGDLIGLESISNRNHLFSLSAVEKTKLCVIPLDALFELMEENSNIMKRFINITSLKMQNDQSTTMGVTATEKVCDFLMNVTNRMLERNHTEKDIYLPMSQLDISNHLGIAYETVNRIFQNLKANKIIKLKSKKMQVLNIDELKSLGRLDYTIKKAVV